MYAAYIRAAAYGLMAPLIAALVVELMSPLILAMKAGEHSDAESAQQLIQLFEVTEAEFLLLEALSIAVFVIVRAIVEKQFRGGYA